MFAKVVIDRALLPAFLAVFFWVLASSAHAADDWRIMVLGDDAAPAAVKRSERAFDRIRTNLMAQLNENGFQVYDAAVISDAYACEPDCPDLNDAALIDIANGASEPIDMVAIFSAYTTQSAGAATERWGFRVEARLIDIETGLLIESYDPVALEAVNLSVGCDENCLEEKVGEQFALIARELGSVLAEKLDVYERIAEFRIELTDFALGELTKVENALRELPGYAARGLNPIEGRGQRSELMHTRGSRVYRYQSTLPRGAIRQGLEAALDDIGATAAVELNGRVFVAVRQGMPYSGRYTFGLVGLVLILSAAALAYRYARIDMAFKGYERRADASRGLDLYRRLEQGKLPTLKSWEQISFAFSNAEERSASLLEDARTALRQHDYGAMRVKLRAALEENRNNEDASTLLSEVAQFEEAHRRYQEAVTLTHEDPSQAMRLLQGALADNPHLSALVEPAQSKAEDILIRGTVANERQAATRALEKGNVYEAISCLDKAIAETSGIVRLNEETSELQGERARTTDTIKPLSGATVGAGVLKNTVLLPHTELAIGRKSSREVADVALSYKRVSRASKQVRLKYEGGRTTVEDLGSANGTHLDDIRLSPNKQTVVASDRAVLAMGGAQETDTKGLCRLLLTRPISGDPTTVLRVDASALALIDQAALAAEWPQKSADLSMTWIQLVGELLIAPGQDGLEVGCANRHKACASISYRDGGYWLKPLNGSASEDAAAEVAIRVDGSTILGSTPLSEAVLISIGPQTFSLSALPSGKADPVFNRQIGTQI